MIKVYLGKEGLNKTWQKNFKPNVKCTCGANARIMFVVHEDFKKGDKYVTDLHENGKDNKYWLHDCIAVANYLCENCFEPIAVINQA